MGGQKDKNNIRSSPAGGASSSPPKQLQQQKPKKESSKKQDDPNTPHADAVAGGKPTKPGGKAEAKSSAGQVTEDGQQETTNNPSTHLASEEGDQDDGESSHGKDRQVHEAQGSSGGRDSDDSISSSTPM